MLSNYQKYLAALLRPYKKLSRIEFLQPDNSIAFTLDNNYKRGYNTKYDTRAFIQNGNLSVSLQNGQRRKASILLSNLDGAFDYAVNKIWFGQKIRLSMGVVLPDGTDYYLPQGVFYISNPSAVFSHNERTTTLNLVDKWAYLDGSLFGRLENSYKIENNDTAGTLWNAMTSLLQLSRKDFENTADKTLQIDNVNPVFTNYYDGKTYDNVHPWTSIPYKIIVAGDNATVAQVLLELNGIIVGWIGYDQTGALRVDASQNDTDDVKKPVLWNFTPENSTLVKLSETYKNSDVYNDVIITAQNLVNSEIYGRATNIDSRSDTNVNIIGRRTYRESQPNFFSTQQCVDLAEFRLKRKTVLQKSITVESQQLFHLVENDIITVKRTDKEGSPVERHLIQSFSLPIGETGSMSISCVSVNDIPDLFTTTSSSDE